MTHVVTQLATLRDALVWSGADRLNSGYRLNLSPVVMGKWHGCVVRTGYTHGEATFWVENTRGQIIEGTYYRGDDLLYFLLNEGATSVVKNIGEILRNWLDRG